ncbi:MAG: hypothetical protein ACPGOY_17050 [Rhodospirillaceae bacterium]
MDDLAWDIAFALRQKVPAAAMRGIPGLHGQVKAETAAYAIVQHLELVGWRFQPPKDATDGTMLKTP